MILFNGIFFYFLTFLLSILLNIQITNQVEELEVTEEKSNNANSNDFDEPSNSVKTFKAKDVGLFFLSSEHFLNPANNFKLPRESFDLKLEKLTHIKIEENLLNNPRQLDLKRLTDYFESNKERVNIKIFDSILLNAAIQQHKYAILDRLTDYFKDSTTKNKILWISGVCNKNKEFEFVKQNLESTDTISYKEILDLWKRRYRNDQQYNLNIIIDCPYGGLWVEQCQNEYDYKDISIQSASTGTEMAFDMNSNGNYGSLFVNNFIHAQKVLNHTFLDETLMPIEQVLSETKLNPILSNPHLDAEEEKEIKKKEFIDNTILDDSRLIHFYNQTPSSCGNFFNVAENYRINSIFNSWTEIANNNENYYKVKNYTEINAIYKGEFSKGAPNGKGAIFYLGIKEKYMGDFVFAEKQGRGVYIHNDTNTFEGIYRKDNRVKGLFTTYNGDWYVGEFANEIFNGKGKFFNRAKEYIYEGDFKDGVQEGFGQTITSQGHKYVGMYKDNEYNGKVKLYINDTLISDAHYVDGQRHGKGWFLLKEGHNYTGNFYKGMAKGQGSMKFKGGDMFIGEFDNGKPNGIGKIKYSNGNVYEGPVKDGLRHGFGKLNVFNGDVYEGDFINDRLTGKGTMYYEKGIYKGDFVDGRFHGKGSLHLKSGGRYEGEFKEGRIYRNDDDL